MKNNKKYEEYKDIEMAGEEAAEELTDEEEIFADDKIADDKNSENESGAEAAKTEKRKNIASSFKNFSAKKKIGAAAAAVIAAGLISLLIMFFMKTDYMEAKQKALLCAGANPQIISEESDNEFLFLNEYSFEIYSDNGYYEIEINAFGTITSVEHSSFWD